jgi:hypothetical protein
MAATITPQLPWAMVPSPHHRHIQQLANMLRNKSLLLKLENIIALLSCIVDALCLCVFRLQMMETRDPNWLNQ